MNQPVASTSGASAAPGPPSSPPLRVIEFTPKWPSNKPKPQLCFGRQADHFVLVEAEKPKSEWGTALYTHASALPDLDAFPGYSIDGKEMFWAKDYSENIGMLDQLVNAGWVKRTGRTIKQGFVILPMVELQLAESEISHNCAFCDRFEHVGDAERFGLCSKCKKRYYCSRDHQVQDYPEHKRDCKLLSQDRKAEVENRKRRETVAFWEAYAATRDDVDIVRPGDYSDDDDPIDGSAEDSTDDGKLTL